MFYTIYKITNLIDGKIYIGKHQTKDLNDGYMGSGKQLKRAQAKHGIENFEKVILFQFDNEADMNTKEAELVTEEFCLREDTYNLCPGGKGGWGYINSSLDLVEKRTNNRATNDIWLAKAKINAKKLLAEHGDIARTNSVKSRKESHPRGTFYGKKHSEEWKTKHSSYMKTRTGEKSSQFGTMWITNGQENKKIKKDVDIIPEGWYKGRITLL